MKLLMWVASGVIAYMAVAWFVGCWLRAVGRRHPALFGSATALRLGRPPVAEPAIRFEIPESRPRLAPAFRSRPRNGALELTAVTRASRIISVA